MTLLQWIYALSAYVMQKWRIDTIRQTDPSTKVNVYKWHVRLSIQLLSTIPSYYVGTMVVL